MDASATTSTRWPRGRRSSTTATSPSRARRGRARRSGRAHLVRTLDRRRPAGRHHRLQPPRHRQPPRRDRRRASTTPVSSTVCTRCDGQADARADDPGVKYADDERAVRPTASSTWSPARPGCSPATTWRPRRSTCCSSTRPASWPWPTRWPRPASARNLVLLGDPLQLPQVAQAVAPGRRRRQRARARARRRCDHARRTAACSSPRPGACTPTSAGSSPRRSTRVGCASHDSCAGQTTEFGTGLRWLRAEHDGCTTESEEEAELVAGQIRRMIGTTWTNQKGEQGPLTADDFMVVAPYNDQVDLIRDRARRRTRAPRACRSAPSTSSRAGRPPSCSSR